MTRNPTLLNWSLVPTTLVLLALLALSLLRFRGADALNAGRLATALPATPQSAAEETRRFFDWPSQVVWVALTNHGNPFFTLAIRPAAAPKPAPPPPTTRKVDLTYRGFLETSAGVRRAVVQVSETQIIARLGEKIVADFVALEIGMTNLVLTNGTDRGVSLQFAKPQPLEIPAK